MDFLARFWSKVKITESCWLWTGALSGDGYARVRLHGDGQRGNAFPAHQVAYELVTGERWPGGMDGHHWCNVRACIRPDAKHVVPREPEWNKAQVWADKRRREFRARMKHEHLHGRKTNVRRNGKHTGPESL